MTLEVAVKEMIESVVVTPDIFYILFVYDVVAVGRWSLLLFALTQSNYSPTAVLARRPLRLHTFNSPSPNFV